MFEATRLGEALAAGRPRPIRRRTATVEAVLDDGHVDLEVGAEQPVIRNVACYRGLGLEVGDVVAVDVYQFCWTVVGRLPGGDAV